MAIYQASSPCDNSPQLTAAAGPNSFTVIFFRVSRDWVVSSHTWGNREERGWEGSPNARQNNQLMDLDAHPIALETLERSLCP